MRSASARVRQGQQAGGQAFDSTKILASLHGKLSGADKTLRDLRQQKRAIDARGDLTASEKSRRRASIEEKEARVFLSFNSAYVRLMGPQGE